MDSRTEFSFAGNRLLAGMQPEDQRGLWPTLHRERFQARAYLERTGNQTDKVYFIESGVVSILEAGDMRDPIEVGLIGNEGMTGSSAIVGLYPQRDSYVQVPGQALVVSRSDLHRCVMASRTLLRYLLRYIQTQMVQLSLTASAGVRANVRQRLARKLLMYHDRLGVDDLPLTHENMSIMLGVRRATVTLAIHNLEAEGWIKAQRGLVQIRDRQGLEGYCGPFYGVAEARYAEIMGNRPRCTARERNGGGAAAGHIA